MAKRKSKKPQQEDASILSESSAPRSVRTTRPSASPALLIVVLFSVGALSMGWYGVHQQHSIDQLSESFRTMHMKITNLQQVMETTDTQTDPGLGMEERIVALEDAQKQAQQEAEVALATSEKLKNTDLYSDLWALHEEMDTQWAEIKQVSLSIKTLQDMMKNHSEEFDTMKERVVTVLSSSSALAENVAGLTSAVSSACSRADEHFASVEALNAVLGEQSELMQTKQAMRAHALEEMLTSVQTTLDEQFFTSQNLHSSVMSQLQMFHTQLVNSPSWSIKLNSNKEEPAVREFITTSQSATEVPKKIEDVEEQAEQQGAQDAAKEKAKEDKEEA
ncbi:hypothetical protein INR49_014126 [Caranx melampygus]|nr:hypothetical protein INR49_014126 [Caranx melampygus]